jgi:hypothetical protein
VQANFKGKILAKKIPSEVKYALAEIKTKTLVPIVIPTVLPRYDIPIIAGGRVEKEYAKDAYEIFYGTSERCTSSKCSFGSTGGELISEMTEDPIKVHQRQVNSYLRTGRVQNPIKKQGGYITLARGIRGFYVPSFCLVYCGDDRIVWQQGKYQYYVAIPKGVGRLDELVKIANSAIDNQP